MNTDLITLSRETTAKVDVSIRHSFPNAPVGWGGPTKPDEVIVLHGYAKVDEARQIVPGVYVGGSFALRDEIWSGNLEESETFFIKGHASWAPGQLEREIKQGIWTCVAVSSNLILRHAGGQKSSDSSDSLWCDILSCISIEHKNKATKLSKGDKRLKP
mmetsp:Transcript_14183/g.21573  ORF Transcript_14183/g.21573 Transcript_14183/m.21573 type:complete len:159 (-) Transcript_14183:1882-2358(-)